MNTSTQGVPAHFEVRKRLLTDRRVLVVVSVVVAWLFLVHPLGAQAPHGRPEDCSVHGRVVDLNERPVEDVQVTLLVRGQLAQHIPTDHDGQYAFGRLGATKLTGGPFNAALDAVEVLFTLRSSDGAYAVHHGDTNTISVLSVGGVRIHQLPENCVIDVGPESTPPFSNSISGTTNLADWGRLLRTFGNVGRAKQYSETKLGVEWDHTGQLLVVPFCATKNDGPCTSTVQAGWDGTQVGVAAQNSTMYLKTRLTNEYTDGPTNVEYHETGHHVLMEAFSNSLPYHPPGTGEFNNHGGLYLNTTSNDALIEGFAVFFASQVRRDMDGIGDWWMYPVAGSQKHLEMNYKVWDSKWEELAFAGVLVDLVDSDNDYKGFPSRSIDSHDIVDCPRPKCTTDAVTVNVLNDTGNSVPNITVVVTFNGGQTALGVVRSSRDGDSPQRIEAGETARAIVPIPDGLTSDEIFGAVALSQDDDDDDVEIPLRDLWAAIQTTPFPTDAHYPHPTNVKQIYESLSDFFGHDLRLMEGIDQVFIEHGYFNDTADGLSNRRYDPGEIVGGSGYIKQTFLDEMRSNPEREAPTLPPIELAFFDVVGADAAFVEVLVAANPGLSYAYESRPDEKGLVGISLPGPDSGAVVRISAVASGKQPLLLDEIIVSEFWARAQATLDESVLSYTGVLQMQTSIPENPGRGSRVPVLTAWLVAVTLGLVVVVASRRRASR